MKGLCSTGYAFDAEVIHAIGFAARMNRVRLGQIVKHRKCFIEATDESAGESVQRMLGLNDFEVAGMRDQQLGWLTDVLLDVIDDCRAPALEGAA